MSVFNVIYNKDGTVAETWQEGAIFSRANLICTVRVWDNLDTSLLHRLNMARPDGKKPRSVWLYSVGVKSHNGVPYNTYEYNLTDYQMEIPGSLACSVDAYKVVEGTETPYMTCATFLVEIAPTVEETIIDEGLEDDDYGMLVEDAITKFQELANQAKTVEIAFTADDWIEGQADTIPWMLSFPYTKHNLENPALVALRRDNGADVLCDTLITTDKTAYEIDGETMYIDTKTVKIICDTGRWDGSVILSNAVAV